ncbi:MAG: hypothetical protein AAF738_11195, partial [Bacteroidota bacterium]
SNTFPRKWWAIGLTIFIVLLFTPFRIILLRSLPFLAVAGFLWWFALQLADYFKEKQVQNSIQGSIQLKLDACAKQIQIIEQEQQVIAENIAGLEYKTQATDDISSTTWKQSLRLINEFRQELDLRNTKLQFYRTCTKKLESLLQNHQFAQEIARRQERLQQLREKNQDDIANLEAFKNNIEIEKHYLEAIDQLSLRMLGSTSLQDAEAVQNELDNINQELRDL